jgi:hypothetical protein
MERIIEISHMSLEIDADFERFTGTLEESLGRIDTSIYEDFETDSQSVIEGLTREGWGHSTFLEVIRSCFTLL